MLVSAGPSGGGAGPVWATRWGRDGPGREGERGWRDGGMEKGDGGRKEGGKDAEGGMEEEEGMKIWRKEGWRG